jgi:formylglycine-generating enzyme required for sulfatase activity
VGRARFSVSTCLLQRRELMSRKSLILALLAVALAAVAGVAQAATPETVPVGDPGNKADSTGFGAVAYEYRIGKYEVTNEEYCEFLNAVAKSDRHELYDDRMGGNDDRSGEPYGGITREGNDGSYTYKVKEGKGKEPIGYVTVESCLRFCNWLTNGKGNGDTEKGAYDLTGGVKVPDHAALAKGAKTTWVMSSENEWYKAAYYDPKKPGGAGYWLYPAKSDDVPEANLNSNSPTAVGSKKVASAYGTYDQGGNSWEYSDHQAGNKWGLRGGSWYINDNEGYMRASTRYDVLSAKWPHYGFRVVALGGSDK